MQRVVITGGSGKAGRTVVRHFVDCGYGVTSVDLTRPAESAAPSLVADLADLGETIEALRGANAVVHLAAIPAPGIRTAELTFRNNLLSTYNVFAAASILGIRRVAWASSETVLGLPYGQLHARVLLEGTAGRHLPQPEYAPVDEAHPPRPASSYSLSKVLGEEMGRQFHRWTGSTFVALRFSNILDPDDYTAFREYWTDAALREWNLWSYVDARDVAESCRLALEAEVDGADVFIIAAGDTVMNRPSRELMAERFPEVPLREPLDEFGTLLSVDKARRVLGYRPAHSWRATLS
jgi:nucleoside-diphosphate-sugar epimerase